MYERSKSSNSNIVSCHHSSHQDGYTSCSMPNSKNNNNNSIRTRTAIELSEWNTLEQKLHSHVKQRINFKTMSMIALCICCLGEQTKIRNCLLGPKQLEGSWSGWKISPVRCHWATLIYTYTQHLFSSNKQHRIHYRKREKKKVKGEKIQELYPCRWHGDHRR